MDGDPEMSSIDVYSPIARTRLPRHALAPRLKGARRPRIGYLDNMKANAAALLKGVAVGLANGPFEAHAAYFSKNATTAAPDTVFAHLRACRRGGSGHRRLRILYVVECP